jgi:competence protein ComEC
MKVLQFPLLKITGSFVLGILCANYAKPSFLLALLCLLVGMAVLCFFFFTSKKNIFQKFSFGVATLIVSFFIGVFTLVSNNQTLNTNHYLHQLSNSDKEYSSEIVVKEKLKNSNKNDRYVAFLYKLNHKESCGKVILNIKKDSILQTIEIGTHLKVIGSLYVNRNPNNPNQFDYGNYLENQQIYAQLYADASDIN